MSRIVILGLLLGMCAVFPPLAELAATAALRLLVQPVAWAFAAGIVARPRLARRLPRRLP